MSRFGAYLYQSGGCDYTIGCGHLFVLLPEYVKSMQEARDYVINDENRGSINYYGPDRISKCVIHEISDSFEVDMDAIHQEIEEKQVAREKEKRKQQFEKLKEEFG